MKKIILLFTLSTLVIVSCKFDKGELPVAASTFKCDSTVHYNPTIANIILTNCQPPHGGSGCHEAGGSRDYSTWALLSAKVTNGSLLNRVVNLKTMPAAGPLPDSLISRIHCWITEGGPNN